MHILVVKRDKTEEKYDPQKILKVVKAAGLNKRSADDLVEKVNIWLRNSKRVKVTSLQIRDRIVVEIQKIDNQAARKYIWYEKYKDKNFKQSPYA